MAGKYAVQQAHAQGNLLVACAFEFLKMTLSIFEPVSIKAVEMMVKLPPSSTFRAAPKTAWDAQVHEHPPHLSALCHLMG